MQIRDRKVSEVQIPDRPARAAIPSQGRIDTDTEEGELVAEAPAEKSQCEPPTRFAWHHESPGQRTSGLWHRH